MCFSAIGSGSRLRASSSCGAAALDSSPSTHDGGRRMTCEPIDVIAYQHDGETYRRAATSLVGGVQVPIEGGSTYPERLAYGSGGFTVFLHPAGQRRLLAVQLGRPTKLPA